MNGYIVLFVLFSTFTNAVAQFLLRRAAVGVGPFNVAFSEPAKFLVRLVGNLYFLPGLSLYVVSMFSWLFVLSKLPVSVAYPLASLGFLMAAAIGFFWGGEDVSWMRVVGILVICAGIFIVSRS